MSQENVEIVRRMYDAVSARLVTPPELLAPGYEVDAGEVSPEGSWPRDYEGAEEVLRDYWQTFEQFHIEVEEVIHADDQQVVTVVRDGGRMKGTDSEVWNRFFHVWTINDGKIARLSIHTDRGRALQAAGLS